MHLIYLLSFIFIEIASSQIISNGMQNYAANSKGMAFPNAKGLSPSGQPLARSMATSIPNARNIGNSNIGNLVNNEMMAANLVNSELIATNSKANSYLGANMVNGLNLNKANANMANLNMANTNMANANMANANMANLNMANANMVNTNMANANFANTYPGANMKNGMNPNVATFNFGNSDNPFTVTSGSPGNREFGIQILADALEIGGTIAVSGRMPVYGAVALNGKLPTDGAASVSYSCGGPQPLNNII